MLLIVGEKIYFFFYELKSIVILCTHKLKINTSQTTSFIFRKNQRLLRGNKHFSEWVSDN